MNKKLNKYFSITLIFVFLLTTILGAFNFNTVSKADSNNNISISGRETVKNNAIYLTSSGSINSNSKIIYSNNDGEELTFSPKYNDDTGFYYFEIIIGKAGNWSLKESNLVGANEINEYNIVVYDDLNSMTGSSTGFIDTTIIKENSSISGDKLESLLSQIKGLDRNGKYSEVTATLNNGGTSGIFYVNFDGDSSSINVPENINLNSGNYTLTLSVDGFSVKESLNLTSSYTNVEDIDYNNGPQLRSLNSESTLSSNFSVKRLSGKNRYATAVEISKSKFSKADNVVIVNGDSINEVLAASSLAKQLNSPILLTDQNTLDSYTSSEINRLGAKNVYIIGNTSKISNNVENTLKSSGKIITRILGSDVYSTAVSIAKQTKSKANEKTLILSSATSYADSLSAAALSAAKAYPILYTDKSSVPATTMDYIKSGDFTNVIIVGGDATVSDSVLNSLKSAGKSVSRVSGTNRYATSLSIANNYFASSSIVNIATGVTFIDSVAGGPVAGINNSPVILVEGNAVSSGLKSYIASSKATTVNIFGGAASVSSSFETSLNNTLNEIYNSSNIQGGNNGGKVKILLDPGHAKGHNRGYVGAKWKNEGDGNYYFSLLLKKELEAYGITVGTTRSSNTTYDVPLSTRGQAAKGYDLFISLHTNAGGNGATGVEIYEDVNARATKLNTALASTISSTLNIKNRGLKYRYYGENTSGINPKSNYYGVLRNNAAPAGMLIEHCFHDNASDVAKYEANADTLAKNMAKVIANYYGIK